MSGRAPCGDGKALLSIENIIRENTKGRIRRKRHGLGRPDSDWRLVMSRWSIRALAEEVQICDF